MTASSGGAPQTPTSWNHYDHVLDDDRDDVHDDHDDGHDDDHADCNDHILVVTALGDGHHDHTVMVNISIDYDHLMVKMIVLYDVKVFAWSHVCWSIGSPDLEENFDFQQQQNQSTIY